MLQPGLSCGRAPCAPRGATTSARITTCSVTGPTAATRSSSRCRSKTLCRYQTRRLRARRGVSADVPDGVAHAHHPRGIAGRGHRAGACGRQRRRAGGDPDRTALTGRACSRPHHPRKLQQARELGAEEVFDHYAGDFAKELRARTAGRGADIVVEHVGEATWDRSVRALASGGRLVTCGATTGHRAAVDLRHLFARQLSLLGSYMGEKAGARPRSSPVF